MARFKRPELETENNPQENTPAKSNIPVVKKSGRPLKFNSAQAFSQKINEYFSNLTETFIDAAGKKCKRFYKPPTISGLALYLGCSRQTLLNYKLNPEYVDSVEQALAICEAFLEEQLIVGRNIMGVMFILKNNYGWRDRSEGASAGEPSIILLPQFGSAEEGPES